MYTFTQNDLLLYLSNELQNARKKALELELQHNSVLQNELENLKCSFTALAEINFTPSANCMSQLMEKIHSHSAMEAY